MIAVNVGAGGISYNSFVMAVTEVKVPSENQVIRQKYPDGRIHLDDIFFIILVLKIPG